MQIPFDAEHAEKIFRNVLNRGEFCDIFLQYKVTTSVRIEDGIIKSATRSVLAGAGVRVVDGESTGYSFCESFDPAEVAKAAKFAQAIAISKRTGTNYSAYETLPSGSFYDQKQPLLETTLERRAELAKRVLEAAMHFSPLIKRVTLSLSDSDDTVAIFNSQGETGSDSRPMVTLSLSAQSSQNGTTQYGRSGVGGRMGFEIFESVQSPEDVGRKAARQAVVMLDARPAPAGVMPVVLGAGESGVLIHESVGHPLEGDFIWRNSSAYAGRVGEQVASPLCTIVDDGTVPGNRGAINFDDELTASRKSVLIEKGILKGYMHDRITAKMLNADRTGNARRESFRYPPIPRMRTTFLEKGDTDPADVIGSVKKGVYCSSFAGGQVNIASGDFVFIPSEAYLIEDGKLTVPIKNLTLMGNGPDVLTRVDLVGRDFKMSNGTWICGKGQVVPVGIGMPTIRISDMTVGGTADEG